MGNIHQEIITAPATGKKTKQNKQTNKKTHQTITYCPKEKIIFTGQQDIN